MKAFFTHPVTATVLKIVISIGLLAGLIYYIDFTAVYDSFLNANALFLTIGIGFAAAQLVVHFFRWRFLLRLADKEISNSEVITSHFVGFMAGFFTPAQVGEFAGRIASHPNVNKSHIIGISLIDKLYWTALTLIIGGLGLAMFTAEHLSEYWNPWYQMIVAIVIFLCTGFCFLPEKMKLLLQMLPKKVRVHRYYEVIQVIEKEFHNPQGAALFGFTATIYLMILVEYYFLSMAFGSVSFSDALICCASVFLVKTIILPISFGDLGIRESVAVFFYKNAGYSAAIAFNASIVMSFANVLIPAAIGAVMVTRLKRK
ncbi:MAG: lysylphosphatidylglycerol synthase transmembrane domain-containing protein [Bacteroidota bacterium]